MTFCLELDLLLLLCDLDHLHLQHILDLVTTLGEVYQVLDSQLLLIFDSVMMVLLLPIILILAMINPSQTRATAPWMSASHVVVALRTMAPCLWWWLPKQCVSLLLDSSCWFNCGWCSSQWMQSDSSRYVYWSEQGVFGPDLIWWFWIKWDIFLKVCNILKLQYMV